MAVNSREDEVGDCMLSLFLFLFLFWSDGRVGLLPVFVPHPQTHFVLYSRLPAGEMKTQKDATSPLRPWPTPTLVPPPTHPSTPLPPTPYLFPTWLPSRLTSQRDNQRQVAPPATRIYLDPDPRQPWQEVSLQPSDLPWWPFLSPCCLAGRKDAVCCPQAPLTRSPLLSLTRETRLLIPGSSSPCAHFFISFLLSPPFLIFLSRVSAPTLSYFDIISFFSLHLFFAPVRCK